MPIEFECSNCKTPLRTPDEAAGKPVKCPSCEQVMAIPAASAFPAPNVDPPTANPFADTHPYSETNPYSSGQPQPMTREQALARLKLPVILLLVLLVLSALFMSIALLGSMGNANGGFEVWGMVAYFSILLLTAIGGIVGCINMLRLKNYALSMGGLICSIIAGLGCCFLPSGIAVWALVLLLDNNIKQHFT